MRHVTFREAGDDLLQSNWGRQAESANALNKSASFPEMTFVMALDIARSMRRLVAILECRNMQSIPDRLRIIEKNTRPKVLKRARRRKSR